MLRRLDERKAVGVESRNCEPFQPRPLRPPVVFKPCGFFSLAAASTQIAALPFRTRPDAAVAPCQVLGPVLGLVEHLCLPVELRRPTRPPRFLPRYHREARRGDLQKTRAITELTDPPDATNGVVFLSSSRRYKAGPSPSKYRRYQDRLAPPDRADGPP